MFNIAEEIVENVRLNLDLELDDLLLAIIAIAFAGYQNEEVSSCVGVILCHGYSTASSIADTANRMLGQYVFDGIDMEINITIDKVAQLADDYLKRKGTIHELIFLVDMGSLEEIYTRIKPMSDYNIALINNNYQQLVENGARDSIFNRYQVELIVGTLDPKVSGVPFMAIESVMMNDEIGVLEQLMQRYLGVGDLEAFNQNITKNFTLSNIVNHLTILNGEKIIDDVEGMEEAIRAKQERVEKVKDAFSGVEMRYSVELPAPEALYVLNYFKNPK